VLVCRHRPIPKIKHQSIHFQSLYVKS
jgi:hypothetical protein